MKTIDYNSIELSPLSLSKRQGTKSKVYIQKDKCYKILTGLSEADKEKLLRKFNDMDGISVPGLIMPQELILDDGCLVGYTMENFANSLNLNDHFTQERFIDVNDIFAAVRKTSLIVRQAHEQGIVLQDFSFDNILINKMDNLKICDLDGCQYKEHEGPFISRIMYNYYEYLHQNLDINENFDNQALLLSMLVAIYHSQIFDIQHYDTMASKIKTLKDIRSLVKALLRDFNTQVPYLDEIIGIDDHFTIDRAKQVPRRQRIAKNYRLI